LEERSDDDKEKQAPQAAKRAHSAAPQFERNTTETRIALKLTIEGKGQYKIATGIRFFDHMLELFTRHGAFDLS
jgi:imidazoleglycerol-phosphate dehydratase